jgi:hypothetical protein
MLGNAGADAGGRKTRKEPAMAKFKAKGKTAAKRSNGSKPRRKSTSEPHRAKAALQPRTKAQACLALLMRPGGATIEELQKLTGWLPHSVRGFLAGTVKKMPDLVLTSDKAPGESRRYRVTRAPS